MKTFKILAVAMIALFSGMNTFGNTNEPEKKVTATFTAITEDYEYEFKTEKGKIITFFDIDFDVDLSLEDTDLGAKYEVTYIEEEEEAYDDEDESSEKNIIRLKIMALKKL